MAYLLYSKGHETDKLAGTNKQVVKFIQ